ncbi:extracellular solute-binding protein [Paenibacillus albiflavus]|uniref:Extracellular solute-binding protein n=1 Tax=Paenibacillus albiflavus TaxID=2545760 RepID=A0A4R4EKH8_9BACL|nr:extracellular solute-binding protein [Paenibacillus albiflavus]TCZ78785.1 extracellular solute-binding protein [Paenibacillus albiflavus]
MTDTIRVLAVGDPAVDAYVEQAFGLITTYEQRNQVKVDFNIVSFEQYYSTMMAAFQGEQDYDIVMVAGHLWLKDFVNKGYLAKVNYPQDANWNLQDIVPVVRQELEVAGIPYLYPSFCDGHMVLYRKSIVKRCLGSLPPDVITTDELLDMVAKCHDVNAMNGIVLKAHPSEILLDFLPYLRNEGVDAFDPKTHLPTFNNEHGRLALHKYIQLRKYAPHDTHTYGNDEVREAFQQLRSVFAVTWGGQLGVVLDERCEQLEDVGFATLKSAWNVTWSFGINAKSNKQQEANALLQYLASSEVDRVIGGYAGSPVRRSTYDMDSEQYDWYSTHLNMIENYAQPLPTMDNAGEILGVLYSKISQAFQAELTVEEALQQAEAEILSMQKERKTS